VKAKDKRRLTELFVRKAKATDGRVRRVWDSDCDGLVLFIQPSQKRAFRYFYSIHGQPRWVHLGWIYLKTAREIGFGLRGDVARGRDPWVERQAERDKITFADLAARHREFAKNKKKNKSWKFTASVVDRHLMPKWGKLDAKTITRADVRSIMAKIDGPMAANQVVKSASAIFSWAVKQELLTTNPCVGVEHNDTTSRNRVLSDSEMPLFWEAFGKAGLPGAALRVLLLTGQRPGEVRCMRHDQIVDGWWNLPGPKDEAKGWPGTKNSENHRVWLPQQVRTIIAELNCDDGIGFVFGKPPALDATMRDICKKLNVPRAVPHDLRRTHGTRITGLGFGRPAMNRVQNHKEGGIASVYDRYEYGAENKQIMESVARHITAIVEGREGDNIVRGRF
jgi:integrase